MYKSWPRAHDSEFLLYIDARSITNLGKLVFNNNCKMFLLFWFFCSNFFSLLMVSHFIFLWIQNFGRFQVRPLLIANLLTHRKYIEKEFHWKLSQFCQWSRNKSTLNFSHWNLIHELLICDPKTSCNEFSFAGVDGNRNSSVSKIKSLAQWPMWKPRWFFFVIWNVLHFVHAILFCRFC